MALVKGLDEARNKPQASKGQSRLIQKYGSDLPLSCCTNKLDYLAVESVNERITKAANRMTAIKSLQNEGIFKAEHLDREWLNSIDEVAKQPESILEKPLPHYLLSDNPTYFGVPQRKSKFAEWGQRQNPGSGSKLTEQNDLSSDTDNLLTSHSSISRDLKVPPDLADILTSHDDEPTNPTNGRPEAGRQKEEEHGQLLPGPLRCLVEPRSNPLFDWSDAPSLSPSPSPSPSPTPPPTFMSSKTNETGNTTTSMFDDLEEEVVDIEGLMEERLDCAEGQLSTSTEGCVQVELNSKPNSALYFSSQRDAMEMSREFINHLRSEIDRLLYGQEKLARQLDESQHECYTLKRERSETHDSNPNSEILMLQSELGAAKFREAELTLAIGELKYHIEEVDRLIKGDPNFLAFFNSLSLRDKPTGGPGQAVVDTPQKRQSACLPASGARAYNRHRLRRASTLAGEQLFSESTANIFASANVNLKTGSELSQGDMEEKVEETTSAVVVGRLDEPVKCGAQITKPRLGRPASYKIGAQHMVSATTSPAGLACISPLVTGPSSSKSVALRPVKTVGNSNGPTKRLQSKIEPTGKQNNLENSSKLPGSQAIKQRNLESECVESPPPGDLKADT